MEQDQGIRQFHSTFFHGKLLMLFVKFKCYFLLFSLVLNSKVIRKKFRPDVMFIYPAKKTSKIVYLYANSDILTEYLKPYLRVSPLRTNSTNRKTKNTIFFLLSINTIFSEKSIV